MSLLEKYKEQEKQLYAKFDEIHKACDEAIEAAGNEFIAKFKEIVANASDEEFYEFMSKSGNELDNAERMAALTARLESYGKRCKEKENAEENSDKNTSDEPKRGVHVVVVELD